MDVGLSLPAVANVSTEANWGPRATMVVVAAAEALSVRLEAASAALYFPSPILRRYH